MKDKKFLDISKIDDIKDISEEESALVRDKDLMIKMSPAFCTLIMLVTIGMTLCTVLIKKDTILATQIALSVPLLMLASAIDIKTHMAPNWIFYSLLIFGIPGIVGCFFPFNLQELLINKIGGFIGGFLLLLISSLVSKGGIGMADIKIMAAVGLIFGLNTVFIGQIIGFFIAVIVSVIKIAAKKATKESKIPLLPYLTAGIMIASFLPNNFLF